MYCKKCGKKLSDNARFCSSCGEPVQEKKHDEGVTNFAENKNHMQNIANSCVDKITQIARAYMIKWRSLKSFDMKQKMSWFGVHGGAAALVLVLFIVVLMQGNARNIEAESSDNISRETGGAVAEFDEGNEKESMAVEEPVDGDALYAEDISWNDVCEWWDDLIWYKDGEGYIVDYRDNVLPWVYEYPRFSQASQWMQTKSVDFTTGPTWRDADGFVADFFGARKELIRDGRDIFQPNSEDSVDKIVSYFALKYQDYISESMGIQMSRYGQLYFVVRDPEYWDSVKLLGYPAYGRYIDFEELEGNIIRFYCYDDRAKKRPYLDIPYRFEPDTGNMIFTLNDKDYTMIPYLTTEDYKEALRAWENSFANLYTGDYVMNNDFFQLVKNTTDKGWGEMGPGTGSSSLSFSNSNNYLRMQSSNAFCNAYWAVSPTDSGQIVIKADYGYPLYANFSYSESTKTLTLTIDGISYSFHKK